MSGVSNRKFLYFKLYINNLSKYDRKKLNDGDNLNVKLGPYGSASNNIVGSLLNKPTQVLNGEVTIDWYPSNDNSNYGTQILRHTRDNTINIYFRVKKGSVDNWSEWINLATKDDLGVTEYNAVGQISLSGKLSKIGEWVKNNGTLGRCTFVRVEPSDSDGYFGTSGFSILWTRTSVNYGWCILISDNPKMVVLGRNSTGWHWYAPSLTEVS